MGAKQERGGNVPMTIIVGLICKDGITMACDSQASSVKGVPIKRTEYTKIYQIPMRGEGYAVLSGVGTGAFITRASEILSEKCGNNLCRNPREFADICEDVMTELFKRYVIDKSKAQGMSKTKTSKEHNGSIQWQEEQIEPPGIVMLTGIQGGAEKALEWSLYTIHSDGVAEKSDNYDSIGSGSAIAEYLLARLWSQELTVEQARKVAIYIVEEVKKIDPFCGGPTQVVSLSKSGVKRLNPREVKEIADLVMEQDENLAEFWRSLILGVDPEQKPKIKQQSVN